MMDFKLDSICDAISYGHGEDLYEHFGTREWTRISDTFQKYYGNLYQNNPHNEGYYSNIKENHSYIYEGSFYAGNFNGYARVTQNDCTYFEGLFKDNKRYGPGVLTYINGQQDVGVWDGLNLIRLGVTVLPEWIPKLGTTGPGKVKLLKYRKLISLEDKNHCALRIMKTISNDEECLKDCNKLYNMNIRNDKSRCFDTPGYDLSYFGDLNYSYIDVPINPEEIYLPESNSSIEAIVLDMNEIIYFILNNMERFEHLTPEEKTLFSIRKSILKTLTEQAIDLKKIKNYKKITTKKIKVTDILTWNNDKDLIEILKHTFRHRVKENIVRFGVSDILTGNRRVFSEGSRYENACISFLINSSEGNECRVLNLFHEFRLNPDLTDAVGNSAVMFASARDHVGIIRELVQLGANLDKFNDEGLTPLSMVLLRYLATLRGIKNWESAFLGVDNSNFTNTSNQDELNNLLINKVESNNNLNTNNTLVHLYNNHNILRSEETDLDWLYAKLQLEKPSKEAQTFQEPYYIVNEISDYIFENKLAKVKVKSSTKKKKNLELEMEHEKLLNKLEVIYNTFAVLLYYGADGNIGEVPFSPLILTLYTENNKILNKLIESGVEVNISAEQGLTALHTLLTLPLKQYMVEFCEVLLKNGADPNSRTPADHWEKLNESLKSNYDGTFNDIGKTCLNIIGLRPDFEIDRNNILGKLTKLLVKYGARIDDKYLGHTTLSLALLKGNVRLVETLLQSGANPNEVLEYDLGTPFTIYALNRYSKILPRKVVCEQNLNLLMQYFANPLKPIYAFGNAVEFGINEKTKTLGRMKKKKSNKSSSKKSSTRKFNVDEIMLKHARNAILKHQTFKGIMVLINGILSNLSAFNADDFCKNIAKITKLSDAMNAIQILLDYGHFNLQNELHSGVINVLLNYIYENGFSNDVDTLDFQERSKKIQEYKNCYNIELDKDETKYISCFYCGLRTSKILLACPKCGLIYYCSQKCNLLGKKLKTQHTCNVLFYNEERKRYDDCLAHGVPYDPTLAYKFQNLKGLFNEFKAQIKNFEKSPDLSKKLIKSLHGKNVKIIDFLNKENQIVDRLRNEAITKMSKRQVEGKKTRSRTMDGKSSKERKNGSRKARSRKGGYDSATTRTKSNKSRSKSTGRGFAIVPGKRGRDKARFKSGERWQETSKRSKDFEKSAKLGKTEKVQSSFYKTPEKWDQSGDMSKVKHVNLKESAGDINNLSPKQRAFIDKLAQFFPELNFPALFVPFVCFNEGQFYYRFTDAHPFFCPTYTGV